MDCKEVRVLKDTDNIRFASLLQSPDGRHLKAKPGAKLERKLSHKPLKGKLADEILGRFLVLADLPKSDGSRAVAVLPELLQFGHDLVGRDRRKVLGALLARDAIARSLPSIGVFDRGLLHACHGNLVAFGLLHLYLSMVEKCCEKV